jgi:signal peptidase II
MKKNRLFWLIGLLGLIFDQLTKFWIIQNLSQVGDTIPLIPDVFHLTYVINTGAAFSFFSGGVFWLRWLSLVVSLGLMAYGLFGSKMKLTEQLGYGFILAGALGNGWDRFLFGYVVDFLDFRLIQFPVFNFADVFINIGVFFLILATFPIKSLLKRRN